jgi:outer membrane protein TolC
VLRRALKVHVAGIGALRLVECSVGPDYRKPIVQIPQSFKEGTDWQRAQASPQALMTSGRWRMFVFMARASGSWELYPLGAVGHHIEATKGEDEASGALLRGQRVATDYFLVRQGDVDIELLKQQQDIDSRALEMTRAARAQDQASSNHVLSAKDTLHAGIIHLKVSEAVREQDKHAIAMLLSANFSTAPDPPQSALQ